MGSLAAVFSVITQRSSPLSGEERCVMTLKTAARETTDWGRAGKFLRTTINQTYNSLTTVVYVTKKCRRILKHVLKFSDDRRYRQC